MDCRDRQKPTVSEAKEKNLGRIQNLTQVNKNVHFYEKRQESAKIFIIFSLLGSCGGDVIRDP